VPPKFWPRNSTFPSQSGKYEADPIGPLETHDAEHVAYGNAGYHIIPARPEIARFVVDLIGRDRARAQRQLCQHCVISMTCRGMHIRPRVWAGEGRPVQHGDLRQVRGVQHR
jgi:hypothetical protein